MDRSSLDIDRDYQLGVDIVHLERIDKIWQNHPMRFVQRLLTPVEREQFKKINHSFLNCSLDLLKEKQRSYLAKRWAAKEAFSKALGCGIGKNFSFQNISILSKPHQKPVCSFDPDTLSYHQIESFDLSFSDEKNCIVAFCYIKKYALT